MRGTPISYIHRTLRKDNAVVGIVRCDHMSKSYVDSESIAMGLGYVREDVLMSWAS